MADVASFLSAVKPSPASDERQFSPDLTTSIVTDVNKRSSREDAAESEQVAAPGQSVSDLTKDITPSGIEVAYQSKPKRLYQVRGYVHGVTPVNVDAILEWREVPSVTTVLDLLRKDGLVWWGQSKGVQGVIDLFDIGALTTYFDWDVNKERLAIALGEDALPADEKAVVELLKYYKLTVNHRLDQASDRGVNVHDALEAWAATGEFPNPSEFPPEESGYVEGLVRFLTDVDPTPIRQEVMVGSVVHGFAGRFDIDLETTEPREYTSRCYPKRADKREILQPGLFRDDLKTSKSVYDSHKLQLAAYELAAVESGYPVSDGQAVIHVTADGKYELVFSDATGDQFLAVKGAYDALKGMA